ncbi:MAG: glycosyltransferase [Kiritimatiellia bacterium]|nr:glycosyltransferase [Kiritimatiellia bacterium]
MDELCTMGISPDQICRQTPVVHVDAVRRAPSLPAPEILFVGRLVPSKGIFDLLDAIGPLDVTVGYIGNGEERARLEKEVQTRGLGPRVTVYGSLPEDQLYGLLRGCRLFVLPSYEEGYGIAIAEAIAAGKPVLAYELPHYTEVFNGAILSVPPGDVRQLSRAIDEILRGTTDLQPYLARYSKIILMDATSAAQNELVLLKKRMAVKSGGTPSPRQNS